MSSRSATRQSDSAGNASSESLAGALLITVDSLRADAVTPTTAPTMTALGDRGTRFESALAHGNWTPFSFPSILSGDPVFAGDDDIGLTDEPTLAETLRDAGVATAGFNDANGFLTEHWGYDRGFEEFEPFMTTADGGRYARYLAAHPTVQGWLRFAGGPFGRAVDRLRPGGTSSRVPDVEQRAMAFLEETDAPFFLWVHYMDAHTPYIPAPKHVRAVSGDRVGALRMLRAHVHTGLGLEVSDGTLRRLRTLYDAAVHQIDASIERLLSALDEQGLREETLVVLAGDHGEEFQEHGHLAHYPKLYKELVHVPLVVAHPDAESRVVDDAVGLDVVPPTVCESMGVPVPPGFDGESVLDVVVDGAEVDEEPVVSVAVRGDTVTQQPIPRSLGEGELLVSARTAAWSYVRHTESGDRELFHRETDPAERENVLEDHPDVAAALDGAVERRIDAIGTAGEGDGPTEVPDEVAGRLEVLGYR